MTSWWSPKMESAWLARARHMEDAGQQLAGHLVHVGDHQEKALGGGEGGGQGSAREGSVHRRRRPCLGLKLADQKRLAEDVLAAVRRPFIGDLSDGG
jgi:hypothetical protein